jgi:hypothetical protein
VIELPKLLRPTGTETFVLRSGATVHVAKATPRLARWTGAPPPSDYGGKPVVEHGGRAAFAELAILWALLQDGWDGAWVTHRRGGVIYRDDLMHYPPRTGLPNPLGKVLAQIHEVRGTHGGTWDVCCQRNGALLFAESKRCGRDRIKPEQVSWLEAGLALGIPLESYLVVEWELVESAAPLLSTGAPQADDPDAGRLRDPATPVRPAPQTRTVQSERRNSPIGARGPLVRREIRSDLIRNHGWEVESHVPGTVSVWPPTQGVSVTEFRDQVVAAVRALGYEPTVIATADEKGRTCIRFHTPETLAQEGRGGHGYSG